jgi:hypothetical protein
MGALSAVAPPNRGRPNTASVEPWNTTFRGKGHEAPLLPVTKSIIVIRLPDEQFLLYLIQYTQPVRCLRHVERVEERLRFHHCSVEIVGDDRNPIQCRVHLVARPGAKELDGEIHYETAFCFAPRIPRQQEV